MSRRWLKPLRLAIALAVLLAFAAAFADFRGLVPVQRLGQLLAHLQFTPALVALTTGGLLLGLGAVAVLLLTLGVGRVYCSTLCPLGLLQDAITRIADRMRPRRPLLPFARPQNALRYGMLAAVALIIAGGAGGIAYAHADPYSNFGRIFSGLVRPLLAALNNALVAPASAVGVQALFRVEPAWPSPGILWAALFVLLLLVILAAWRGRIYCNTLCPVGTLLGLVSRFAAFRLKIDGHACTKCASCLRSCKAQCIDLRTGVIDASRCVGCFNCLDACRELGLGYEFSWSRPTPALAPAAAPPALAPHAGPAGDPGRRALLLGAAGLALAPLRAATDAPAVAPPAAAPVTPPGAGGTERFLERCSASQLCVSACLTGVLRPATLEYGFAGLMKPHLDFTRSFCNYDCRRCGEACPTGAIANLALPDKQLTSIGLARFNQDLCVVETEGTDCAACSEHCPTKAVETVPFRDNLRLPRVDDELCIGCGACQYACPVRPRRAITVEARPVHTRAKRAETEQPAARPVSGFPF